MKTSVSKRRTVLLKNEDYFREGHHLEVREQTTVNFPSHGHTYFELEILLGGEGVQTIGEDEFAVGRGSVYIMTPTDVHCVVAREGELVLWNVVFDEQMLSEERYRTLLSGRMRTPFRLGEEVLHCADRLVRLIGEESEAGSGCERRLFDCLLSILEDACPADGEREGARRQGAIERALLYLRAHVRDRVTLTEVARFVGFHPTYFSEQFKQRVGEGFVDHLNRLRIDYAKTLLAQGVSVTEAALGSGYASLSHFQRTFRRLTGIPPSAYRAAHTAQA